MDFKQLNYIVTIAKEQNITHAAEKLYITRSALNYSLLNLEKELGVQLFTRLPGRLIPTYAGEVPCRFLPRPHQSRRYRGWGTAESDGHFSCLSPEISILLPETGGRQCHVSGEETFRRHHRLGLVRFCKQQPLI